MCWNFCFIFLTENAPVFGGEGAGGESVFSNGVGVAGEPWSSGFFCAEFEDSGCTEWVGESKSEPSCSMGKSLKLLAGSLT